MVFLFLYVAYVYFLDVVGEPDLRFGKSLDF